MHRFALLFAFAGCIPAFAQVPTAVPAPPSDTLSALRRMADGAAVVFAGEVVAIRRQMASVDDAVPEAVEVDFHVDDAVYGCQQGSIYTLREWGGLWSSENRYEVGQHRMMLLHAPGPGGFSSPVMGQDGAVPITSGNVDLRWVQTQTLQPSAPLTEQPVELPVDLPRPPRQFPISPPRGILPQAATFQPAPTYMRRTEIVPVTPALDAVLTLLHTWEAASHAR